MNIEELDAYNLDDAVKFHDHLNPRLWDDREQLRPEVRVKLLEIAADFEEFLGLNDVSVQDITISGSNAAYSYTNHSDIDLHLVVAMPQGSSADVYRELFDAKKYQYNDLHNIRIGAADVELYVQDADQPHHSQGIYSVRNDKWISVPRRRSADVNDSAVQRKYQDLGTRIENILSSSDHEQLARMMTKIKTMRAAGLEREGEFGVDNIVFKLLRNNGLIKRLVDARSAARDAELSLNERKRKKKSSRVRYGYGGYWTPGYNFGGTELGGDSGGGDGGGGESVREASTPDGVSASTKMFLEQDSASTTDIVQDFVSFCVGELGIQQQPQLRLRRDPAWSQRNHSFGQFDTASNELNVSMANRHVMDILRTVAHELVHYHQQEQQDLPPNAGATGSQYENEANARAGELMRNYGQQHPELFEPGAVAEGWRERAGSAALAAACVAGTPGCATTGQLAQGAQIAARTAQTMQGRDIKGMARAELEQEIRNLARAQRGDANAQNLSRIYQLQQRQQQQNESSGYIPTKKERNDPRFSMALSPDVQPGATGKNANKLGLKTNAAGKPALLIKNLKNALREFKETGQLAEQDLFEINMSPTNLKKLAAQTGALAGMEFEMIVPGVEGGDSEDLEPDYDQDERVASIEDAAQFFFDGDYNGRREVQRLRESMSNDYQEWLSDAWMEHFESYKNTIVFRYGKENWNEADIVEIMGMDEAAAEALATRGATPEDYMDAAEKVIADGLDPWLNDAQEDAQQEYYDEDHEDDWLASEGLRTMSDVENQYEIMWPYWSSGNNEGAGIESVADEFREAIGRKVNWSASYHGGKREANAYVVEPDGSLEPNDGDDAGLEFVSPPLPIDEMISDLNKVKAWADQRGCYTSKAAKTGLHINVSVPGFDNGKLDYVKLALLLGDEYVLNQFGRLGNSYASSAMGIIKERIAQRPEDAAAMLQKMKTGLGELATKIIHSGTTSKFTSINTKTGYIEFRSPGGDWLDDNFDKIETTLMRFVVALDAAMDPAKYRDEYLKKLYAVLKPKDQNDTLSYFAKFAAGELPKAALKSFIRQAQLERKGIKTPPGDSTYTAIPSSGNQKYEIQRIANDEIVGTFNAASDTDASAVARQWLADNGLHRVDFRFNRATGQERAEQRTGASNYKIYQISDGPYDGRIVGTFYAADQAQADAEFTDWLMSPAAGGRDDFRYAPIDTPIQGAAANQTSQAYEVYDSNTGATVYQFTAADDAAATQDGLEDYRTMGPHSLTPQQAAQRYLLRRAGTTSRPDIIDIEPDVEQNFVPGSTVDLQRQRQQAAQQSAAAGTFRGIWAIKDSRGNTLHTFGGIGNSQADANRVAAGWLARAGYQDGLEVEVVPVMEP